MSRQELAYDLSRYEQKPKPPVKVLVEPRAQKQAFTMFGIAPFKVIVTALFLVVVLGYMLYSRAMLTEINEDINSYRKQLTTLQAEYTRLDMEAQSRMSLKNIEEYARDVLGMDKLSQHQVEYVPLQTGDEIRVASQTGGLWQRLLDKWKTTFGS